MKLDLGEEVRPIEGLWTSLWGSLGDNLWDCFWYSFEHSLRDSLWHTLGEEDEAGLGYEATV